MEQPAVLKTSRLVLRPLEMGDADALFRLFSFPEVTRYYEIDTLRNEAQALVLLDHFLACGRHAITLEGRFIGSCGLFSFHTEYHSASLGYDLLPECWGKGFMSEALGALLDHGFSSLSLNRINALVHPENFRSSRLLERCCFEKEGIMREFGFWKGAFHDMSLYALLKRHWDGCRKSLAQG